MVKKKSVFRKPEVKKMVEEINSEIQELQTAGMAKTNQIKQLQQEAQIIAREVDGKIKAAQEISVRFNLVEKPPENMVEKMLKAMKPTLPPEITEDDNGKRTKDTKQ